MTSPGREAAAEATCLWLEGDFDACFQTLERLDLNEADRDYKVQHNLAVVEHYLFKNKDKDGQLLGRLDLLLSERTSNSEADAGPSKPALNHPDAAHDEVAVVLLNKAILLYREQRYREAVALLSPLLQHIDALDEGTALHLCLLLVDLHLHQRNLRQAAAVLAVLDKCMEDLADRFSSAPSPHDGESLLPPEQRRPSLVLPFLSKWESSSMSQARQLLVSQGRALPTPPNLTALLSLYHARLALLQRDVAAAEHAIQILGPLTACRGMDGGQARGLPPADLPVVRLTGASGLGSTVLDAFGMLAAAHLQLLRGALAEAATILQSTARGDASVAIPHLAASETASSPSAAAAPMGRITDLRPVVLNNLGVVNHCQGRHQVSAMYFARALDAAAGEERPVSSSSFSGGVGREEGPSSSGAVQPSPVVGTGPPEGPCVTPVQLQAVTYNSGVQHLLLGQYAAALSCFGRCSLSGPVAASASSCTSPMQPLLLLRSAEAVLGLHRQRYVNGNPAAAGSPSGAEGLLRQAHARLQGATQALSALERQQQEQRDGVLAAAAAASPAFHSNGPEWQLPTVIDTQAWIDVELSELQQSALCNMAYVLLLLRDPTAALAAAQQALNMPRSLSDRHAYLTACYAAEALSQLGQRDEAVVVMAEAHNRQLSVSGLVTPGSAEAVEASASLGQAGRQELCTNLAVMLSGKPYGSERARDMACEAAALQPSSRSACLLATYTDLMAGRCDRALGHLSRLQGRLGKASCPVPDTM